MVKPINKCETSHRYRRRNIGTKVKPFFVYACQDCPHYVRPELFIGRVARCFNGCVEEFKIKSKHKKVAFVRCDACSYKKDPSSAAIEKLVEKVIAGGDK